MMLRIPFAALIAFLFAGLMSAPLAQQPARAVAIDDDDIGGVVTSAKGPEAGRLGDRRDDRPAARSSGRSSSPTIAGRYVVPDLPRGTLLGVGARLRPRRLEAGHRPARPAAEPAGRDRARRRRQAAAVYPANYWYSLIKVPDKSEFPGTGPKGNGIAPTMRTPGRLDQPDEGRLPAVPSDGQPRRRARFVKPIPDAHSTRRGMGSQRVQVGQRGPQMSGALDRFGRAARARDVRRLDRSHRQAGEVPPQPPRPQGVERNVVLTQWDWGGAHVVHPRRGRHRQAQPDGQRDAARSTASTSPATSCCGSIRSSTRPAAFRSRCSRRARTSFMPAQGHDAVAVLRRRRRSGTTRSIRTTR